MSDSLTVTQNVLAELKAQNICLLDVRKQTSMTDFMIIASGNSSRQVKALAKEVMEKAKEHHVKLLGSEGTDNGEWALIDFGDLIVHIMQQETRDFYDLESLWQAN